MKLPDLIKFHDAMHKPLVDHLKALPPQGGASAWVLMDDEGQLQAIFVVASGPSNSHKVYEALGSVNFSVVAGDRPPPIPPPRGKVYEGVLVEDLEGGGDRLKREADCPTLEDLITAFANYGDRIRLTVEILEKKQ